MTSSSVERKIRSRLGFIRFMQAYVPLSIARWLIKQGLARVQIRADIARKAISADGVSCEWIIPQSSPSDKVLLYLHGGGFVYGLTPPHLEMVANLAQKIGIRALLVDYRLAPENQFPAPLDDCLSAYRWLLNQGFSSRNIIVAGDSAGGNISIAMMMKLRDGGEPLPAAAVCLSPVANLTDRNNFSEVTEDPFLHPRAIKKFNASYVAQNDAKDPYISPVFGDFRGLPPLLIHAGEDDIARTDAVQIEALGKAAGVDARLEIYPRMWHVWQMYPALPQAAQSLDDIAQFIESRLEYSTQ